MFLNTSRLVAVAAMVLTLTACQNEKAKTIEVEKPMIHATAMSTAAAFMVLKNTSATENDRLIKVSADGVATVEMHTYEHKDMNAGHHNAPAAVPTEHHEGHEPAAAHEGQPEHASAVPAEAAHDHASAHHEHPAASAPMMAMTPVADIEVPAGTEVELKPGGLHIMLIGLPEGGAKAGTSVKMKLTFEKAGEVEVDVPVVAE